MKADFIILSADTVPNNYTWDLGIPLETEATLTSAFTTQTYVSGYAPALRVLFYNQSVEEPGFGFKKYDWDFGDYYNDATNNISLPCISLMEHTFVMPGKYNVSLRMIQSKQSEELDQTGNSLLCRGKYDYRWFWEETECEKETALTWDETELGAKYQKWWDDETGCFEKHCRFWSWNDLKTDALNPVSWDGTATDAEYVKKWTFEPNDTLCKVEDARFLTTVNRLEQTIIKTHVVEVIEKPPIAGMHSLTRPVTGIAPFTVELTPRNCQPGSFPIDRIDWNFGDGSPTRTISRYTPPSADDVYYNDQFPDDPIDVRNFDIVHTYNKSKDDYPVFYPSLTCYSANTNTSDSCSISIGPISLPSLTPETTLLKVRNTLKGNLYAIGTNDYVGFVTTNESISTSEPKINVPTNVIRDTYGVANLPFYGNPGDDYTLQYEMSCGGRVFISPPGEYITTEDSTPLDTVDNLGDKGEDILTEEYLTFLP